MSNPARTVAQYLANMARPHYVFRPGQLVSRVASDLRPRPDERLFRLQWGPEISANPRDPIGEGLLRRGIFDLLVCETLLRLADPGETAIDAGANIGHMTSLLAHAVGPAGRVIAFEPHPEVFARLTANAARWHDAEIDLHQTGLSDDDAEATLSTGVFAINQGSATLEPWTEERGELDTHTVRTERLDTVVGPDAAVGVMKMDIEGHEIHGLRGAEALLSSGRIRDIVFEEREPPPTAVTALLERHGYTVVALGETLRGPVLGPVGSPAVAIKDDPSLLATRDPERAVGRLRVRGWAIYGVGPAARIERRRQAERG